MKIVQAVTGKVLQQSIDRLFEHLQNRHGLFAGLPQTGMDLGYDRGLRMLVARMSAGMCGSSTPLPLTSKS